MQKIQSRSYSDALPSSLPGKPEVPVVVDRAQREWEPDNYFVVDVAGQLEFQWFAEAPDLPAWARYFGDPSEKNP